MTTKTNKAFTLVELIVVIVILAILATIAFLSFSNQSSSARDSTRLSDLTSIAKGLMVNQSVGGKYPIPDKSVKLFSSTGVLIGYQGEAGTSTLNIVRFSAGGGKDPLDKTYYTYSTNLTQNKYQLLSFLENNLNLTFNPFIDISFASANDYSNRYPYERGDQLGIVLSKAISVAGTNSGSISYTPIQDMASMQTSTGFIISDTSINTSVVAVVDNSLISDEVTTDILVGFTAPVNPVPSNKINVTSGDQIKSDTDLFNISGSGIAYIFATGSYYTKNWETNGCIPANISIITKKDFTGASYEIPANTIVKIPNGTYNLNGTTSGTGQFYFRGNCSAIIGESASGVIINEAFTSGGYINKALISVSSKSNNIISNLNIRGGWTATNRYVAGIDLDYSHNNTLNSLKISNYEQRAYSISASNYNTIANCQAFGNGQIGFGFGYKSSYNNIVNSQAFNNAYDGFQFWTTPGDIPTTNNYVNNCQAYNNWHGFYMYGGKYNTISNTQAYNNKGGFRYSNASLDSVLINSQGYNNQVGVIIEGTSSGVIMSNLQLYNNDYGLNIYNLSSGNNKYYGALKLFGNTTNLSNTTGNDALLSAGQATDFPGLGFASGSIDTAGAFSCSYHSQPNIIANWGTCTTRQNFVVTNNIGISYSYGANILNQAQPIRCPAGQTCPNGANLQLYGVSGTDYDVLKKIGQY